MAVELVAAAVAVAVLAVAMGGAVRERGAPLGRAVGHELRVAATGPAGAGDSTRPVRSTTAERSGSWSAERGRSWASGPTGQPTGARLLPPTSRAHQWAVHEGEYSAAAGTGTRGAAATASWCAGCAGYEAGWSTAAGPERRRGEAATPFGLQGTAGGLGYVSVVEGRVVVDGRWTQGPVRAHGDVSLTARLGADADAEARAIVAPGVARVSVGASARAGAIARVEQRAAANLGGVAVSQSLAAEGWAGAGARGQLDAGWERGTVSWRTGAGAALGLGGAFEWSGSVDVAAAAAGARRAATRLGREAVAAGMPLPWIPDAGERA